MIREGMDVRARGLPGVWLVAGLGRTTAVLRPRSVDAACALWSAAGTAAVFLCARVGDVTPVAIRHRRIQ